MRDSFYFAAGGWLPALFEFRLAVVSVLEALDVFLAEVVTIL